MDKQIPDVFSVIHHRAGPDVAFLVPVEFGDAADGGHEEVDADVEFPALIQENVFEVFLDDERVIRSGVLLDVGLDFL